MSANQRPYLVLQPAVNTTTVVTTTTTTTTYAPIQLPPLPPPLSPKDPKIYPLLHANLPKSLCNFPLVFPGGTRATFKDGDGGEEDMQEEQEVVGGHGWRMLKRDEETEGGSTVGLVEAVERYGKKRSHGGLDLMEGVETTSTSAPPRKKARAATIIPVNAAAPPSPLPSPRGSPVPENIWPSAPPSGASSPLPQAPFQPDLSLATLLTRDFITLLPPELVSHILSYLPFSTLARASRVSRAWRATIDSDPALWRDLLKRTDIWFGGGSEDAFANAIFARRRQAERSRPPGFPTTLPLPHPYKILFKSRHLTRTRWVNVAEPNHLVRSLRGHEGGVWALAASKDILVSGSTDRTVRIWDLTTGRCTHVFGGHTSTVRCLAIVKPEWVDVEQEGGGFAKERWPKRALIVTGSRDHSLRVWTLPRPGEPEYRCFEADDGEVDPTDVCDAEENPYHRVHLEGHDHAVRALAARGRTLVSGSYDCSVRIWDIVTGQCKHVLTGHTQKVYSVVLDPIRNQACSGSMDGSVRVWNLHTGQLLHVLSGHTSLVGLLGMSPSHLVSAAADSTLRIWNPDTGELQHTLAAHTGAITCFQHDEFKVLSGSDGNLKMWDMRDGSVVRDLLTGITGVWQVVFEGRWCVAASNRSDVTVLDVWDFGKDDEEDWVGEPPGGTYDEDGFSEAEDEDEDELGTKRIRKMTAMGAVGVGVGVGVGDDEDEEQADVDAMDQDLLISSDAEDSVGDIEVDDVDAAIPAEISSYSGPMPFESAGTSRLAPSPNGGSRTQGVSRLHRRSASADGNGDGNPRAGAASSSRRMNEPPAFNHRTLPSTDETPTRPRIRGSRRQR
ncbi:hypothetical protein H0H92_009188 [Tricholoma furcatifolium]|nr:hypothetical protein H0H92_009188 [Tricholoma furcatifolium]